MNAGASLRRVQDADTRIGALRGDLASAREALRRDPELERARAAASDAHDARVSADAAAAAAESTMKDLEGRVRTLDRRLYGGSVHNPHELMEMQQELEHLRGRLAEAEVAALAALEGAEYAQRAEEAAGREVAAEEARRAAALEPLRQRIAALEAELSAATAEREAAAGDAGAADLALYQRVASRRQPAVVAMSGDACGGCHLPLSIEERRLVRTGDRVVQCSNCDRILVA
ncbi:MAG: hypothetical protein JOZ46_08365 [Candidatus Dormibacteraeota bacterium]|nr:hypothetical protein [Candidatus Dormibacteraeota bacterium]MBV9525809.1 hypothetical protein [Candidatus Dormibacteraeota bacterium]